MLSSDPNDVKINASAYLMCLECIKAWAIIYPNDPFDIQSKE